MRLWKNRAKAGCLGLTAALCFAGVASAQDSKQSSDQSDKQTAPAVVVATVKNEEITQSTQFVGRVQAIQQTDLKARVEGFLEAVEFKEGAMVKTGEQLYQIETGPYEAALASAQAALASGKAAQAGAQAKLQDADLTLERQTTLLKSNTVSQAAVDKAQADRDQAYAEVQSAEAQIADANAQIQTAQLNLSYTKVISPIDGRIGKTNYTKGNLVDPASGTLATVVQMDPMRVVFSISDRDYVQVVETAQHGGTPGLGTNSNTSPHDGAPTADNSGASGSNPTDAGATGSGTAASGSADTGAADTSTSGASTSAASATSSGSSDTASAATSDTSASGSTDANSSASGTTETNATDAGSANSTGSGTATATASADTAGSGTADAGSTDSSTAAGTDDTTAGTNTMAAAPADAPNVDVKDDFVPTLILPNGQKYSDNGKISFIDNEVDPNTGTVAVYADFPNKEFVLIPGQFVTVNVAVGEPKSLPVVPAGAVLQDKQGPYVLIVDKDNRAQIQRIETAEKMQTGWAVSSGLTQGQVIIVDGIQKVQPGMVVNPQTAKPAS